MPSELNNSAILAAREAEAAVARCLSEDNSFLLEAGAGAGKTYSLVEALKSLLSSQSVTLRKKNQRVACITTQHRCDHAKDRWRSPGGR